MRHIGQLPDASQARLFSDFLLGQNIHNEVERESDGTFAVWVREEDQIAPATDWLTRFLADPNAAEFKQGATEAARVRETEKQDLQAYQRRVRTGQNLFPKVGGYGVGVLTYSLIVICVVVALFSKLGSDQELLRHLYITDPALGADRSLPEIFSGQVWRLFTPMFIHFGVIHLIFNMMWLYQLGCMIEARRSTLNLLAVVAVTEVCSSLAQYYVTGHASFGGMSGVVYGLAGYVWIRGKYDRASGLFLDSQSVTILLAWLVICYTGIFGPIANTAHLAGLVVGMVWGGLSAFLALRKPS